MNSPTPEQVEGAVERAWRNIDIQSPSREDMLTILSALKAEQERLDWLEEHPHDLTKDGSKWYECRVVVEHHVVEPYDNLRSAIDSLRNQQTKDSK